MESAWERGKNVGVQNRRLRFMLLLHPLQLVTQTRPFPSQTSVFSTIKIVMIKIVPVLLLQRCSELMGINPILIVKYYKNNHYETIVEPVTFHSFLVIQEANGTNFGFQYNMQLDLMLQLDNFQKKFLTVINKYFYQSGTE